jgi:hypothetical protein
MIWNGEIGNVTEVHAWTDRPIWPQGLTEIPTEMPVPDTLDWDLWLGIANMRPFTQGTTGYPNNFNGYFYQPFNWRGFYDFGCGALGDMACHILGAPNMALRLGAPTSVECIKKEGVSPFMFPKASTIKFEFPARGNMPPVTIYWYDGMKVQPEIKGVPAGEYLGDLPRIGGAGRGAGRGQGAPGAAGSAGAPPVAPPATGFVGQVFRWNDAYLPGGERQRVTPDGSLFIGDKGMITTGTYGEQTRLLPVEKMRDYKFPSPLLTRSPGHYRDWIRAAKGGDPAVSNFNVAAPFVQWMLLGVIALRVEGKLEWDAAKGRFSNNNDANKYLAPTVRKPWSLT